MRRGQSGLLAVLVVGALAVTGCTGDEEPPETPSPVTPTETATEPSDSGEDLPGEPFDTGPVAGARLAVVGTAADDVLNFRAGPGVDFDVLAGLAPLADGLVATGRSRQLDSGAVWVELTVDGTTGWVNFTYVAYLGEVEDLTDQFRYTHGLELIEVAERVVEGLWGDAADDLTLVVVDGPYNGLIGEVTQPGDITVDVLGMADDSVLGTRLLVVASPDGGSFTLQRVEATTLCSRGVQDGHCI